MICVHKHAFCDGVASHLRKPIRGASEMRRLQCAEIWGGIHNQEQDVCSAGIVASLYSAASDGGKGGDIYYLSVCESDLLTRVAIADVRGHGQAVSEVSQFIYDALKLHMNDPAEDKVLNEVNRLAVGRGIKAMTTAAVISFYRSDNNLYFAYAGHYPVLVKRKRDRNWYDAVTEKPDDTESADRANLPLAIMPDTVFTQQSVPLAAGDRLFLYTDGIIEAPDHEDNFYGIERLKVVLEEQGGAPLEQLRTTVLKDLHKHTGGELTHDDVTFLAIEIR
jgi:sigma-B regulation protein RsbU (phosphoserine phosphatase)